ncbi:MAG: hypothetical protein M1818_005834 [Claussenomyces sp. TS43310]|nr:MAG: hypothetical protein M1818_005834 [Claussenomyces sp. TS43310]
MRPPRESMLSKLHSRREGEGLFSRHRGRDQVERAEKEKHVRLEAPEGSQRPLSSGSHIYMGSYGRSPRLSRVSLGDSSHAPQASVPPSPRTSISHARLDLLLENLDLDLDTYGVEELRDGFFDASFFKPKEQDREQLMKMAECTLPAPFQKQHPLSLKAFLPRQWHELNSVARRITTTRAGIKLTKSFLAYFIAYVLCLVPAVGNWLGPFAYIMALSTIINHPGRTIGAQLDGTFFTILGTVAGLGWGALALFVSSSTSVARDGYGGVVATFLLLFIGPIAVIRSYFIRSYQMGLSAGIAVIYTCLSDTSQEAKWSKIFDYGIPWLFGQAISFLVCLLIYPDGGARPLAVGLHNAFAVMQDGLKLRQPDSIVLYRKLAWTFVNLSQIYRDLALDISVTRFLPSDIIILRNRMQAVIRALLSLRTDTSLFTDFEYYNETGRLGKGDETVIDIEGVAKPNLEKTMIEDHAIRLVTQKLAEPTLELLACMKNALSTCDAVLLSMSGYRKFLGPPDEVSSDVLGSITSIRKAIIKFDNEDDTLTENNLLPATFSDHPRVVEMFLFVNPIRQAATSVEALLVKVMEMQQKKRGWRIFLPSYPLSKSLQRTNAQVRHDRGGVTAGFFFRSQNQLRRLLHEMQSSTYRPLPRHMDDKDDHSPIDQDDDFTMDEDGAEKRTLRYKAWVLLHELQGFETRFALKVAIVVSMLAVPAWLDQSKGWYVEYESWWAVATVWMMMHPRVGGNVQDLVTRSLTCILGAAWGGFAYAAGNGNPYVMAVFAAIYMIPMMYRFTQSSHPRSGIVGCVSFTVVSLHAYYTHGQPTVVTVAWTRGVAFVVGVVASVLVNWILWPFVARHELRKSLASMILHLAIIYRGVVAKYIYYEDGREPSTEDVTRSELLEGRLREGFVRIRQLMALTRHEVRLRAPFDPLPYSALIEGCESFFEHLVEVRQASLFFHPNYMSDNTAASEALLPFRRDAVAAILMNLYVLSGALRGGRPVPRYLPSAAAARKKLLDRMAEVEAEYALERGVSTPVPRKGFGRKFAEVYQFAYSQALTQCVEQLEQLEKYTKVVCDEVGFDAVEAT